jgi:hypothetical protein
MLSTGKPLRAMEMRAAWAVAVAVVLAMWASVGFHQTGIDNYVLLADAFRHGHLWVDRPGAYIDAMPYAGRWWIIEAPGPALLLLPFVLFSRDPALQSYLALALLAVIGAASYALERRLGLGIAEAAACSVLASFGTSAWYCAANGDVWCTAHLGGVAFTLLALGEVVARCRPGIVAAFAVGAVACRFPFVLALPLYWALIPRERRTLRSMAQFLGVVVLASAAYALYDVARWGTVYDQGYALWYHIMDRRSQGGAPAFALSNVPHQLEFFLVRPPREIATFPWLVSARFGLALTFATPALVYVLWAPVGAGGVRILALMLCVSAAPALLYFDTGGVQAGNRHALDFIPFAIPLFGLGVRRLGLAAVSPLVAWSVFINVTSTAVWMADPSRLPL